MTDNEIVENIRRDQLKDCDLALRYLYTKHYGTIQNLILKNNGNNADAKDIFQDAMVVLYNNVKTPDFILSSKLSTYLYAISRNLWLKKLKLIKKEVKIEDIYTGNIPSHEIIDVKENTQKSNALTTLLEKSGEKCLKLLKMFYFERLSMKEISNDFGYSSEQVAKNKKVRCLKKIRLYLHNSKEFKEVFDY